MHLLKIWYENKYEITIDHGGNQSKNKRNMKNVNFVPKDVQRILSSHKIPQKYNEQWGVLYKKQANLKNFAIFTGKHEKIT